MAARPYSPQYACPAPGSTADNTPATAGDFCGTSAIRSKPCARESLSQGQFTGFIYLAELISRFFPFFFTQVSAGDLELGFVRGPRVGRCLTGFAERNPRLCVLSFYRHYIPSIRKTSDFTSGAGLRLTR